MAVKLRILVFLLVCSNLLGQASPAKFYSVNSLFGISVREVNSVCDDSKGFIWASSKTCILRLTEDDYRVYHLPYETSNVITVKLINAHSKLCAYANNGQVFTYNTIYDRFDLEINLNKALNDPYIGINALLIDEAGDYWIATTSGLYKYHAGRFTLINEQSFANYSIAWKDRQHLIVAGFSGIMLLDIHTMASEVLFENKGFPLMVSSLFYDETKDALWVGTIAKGLYLFDFHLKGLTPVLETVFPHQPVLAIEKNSDGSYLIGIDGQGLWKLNEKADQVLSVFKENADDLLSIRGNGVYDIFRDRSKRIWVGTISGGLSFFDQESPLVTHITHQTNNINSLINNDVNSLIEDHSGKMWLATNNGISCWNQENGQWKHFYYNKEKQAQVFLTICEDNQGRIWAGSYSSGIYVLDSQTGRELAHYSRTEGGSPVVSNFILNIYKDSRGDLWFGVAGPDYLSYQVKEQQFKTYSREPVACFAELTGEELFLGCSNGLSLLNKKTGVVKKLLQGMLVRDMELMDDNLWIGTSGSGLIRYNYKNGQTEKFTTESGLPSNFVNGIVRTGDFLWLGTENGLCRFNLKDKNVITYASIYPLSRNSFNNTAHFKMKDGQLAWGTNNGAVLFLPDLLSESSSKGRIIFQDLMVSGRSVRDLPGFNLTVPVDSLKDIRLKYFQNTVSLELLPIGISSGSKFSWKMEGFDKQWSTPTANRIITYTNIPNGHFNLKVRLYDGSSANVITERSIALRVIPPFWRTGWFSMLVVIVVGGMIVLYFLYYTNRLKQRHTEEKVRFFTNTAHDIRTSLTLIKAPVDELSREMHLSESGRKYLQLAKDQARQLTAVVTQLMDFQKADIGKEQLVLTMTDIVSFISGRIMMFESLAQSRNIELVFTADLPGYRSAVDEMKMEKVVDNLISNAVKYSHPGSQVAIDLKCSADQWSLEVKDSGIGISKKAQRMLFKEFYRSDNAINSKVVGSGIGLLLVKKYVDLHQGTVSCESQENAGSTFKIIIPAKKITVANNSVLLTPDRALEKEAMPESILNGKEEAESITSPEMKILVVEDNDELLNFMKSTLGREFTVLAAVDGKDAWNVINENMPDLIISDVMMPNMDGYELCHLVKSTYETSHIPVILLTALSEKSEQLRGLGLGADDYLTKPFDTSLLIQKIKTIIRNRRIVGEKVLKMVKHNSSEPVLENRHNDQFMRRILEVVKANISNPEFNKEDFASAMNVSSSLLYKKIKSLTDQSPSDFIKTYRLNHALELLETGLHNVTEISEMCGFTSIGYFSTVFKKHYGKSPTEILN